MAETVAPRSLQWNIFLAKWFDISIQESRDYLTSSWAFDKTNSVVLKQNAETRFSTLTFENLHTTEQVIESCSQLIMQIHFAYSSWIMHKIGIV